MNDHPLVSICIPVYNTEKYIRDALLSAINQTYKNIEIIVVDNNSDDGTVEIVQSLLESDNRISLFVNSENIGMYPNFNKSMDYAKGHYIKFLCADDLLQSDCIEYMVSIFRKHKGVSIVSSNQNFIDGDNKIQNIKFKRLKKEKVYKGHNILKKMFRKCTNKYVHTPSHVMIKNTGHISFETYNESGWGNDMECWMQYLAMGDLYYVEKKLIDYRYHSENASTSVKKRKTQYLDLYKTLRHWVSHEKINSLDRFFMEKKIIERILCDRKMGFSEKMSYLESLKLNKFFYKFLYIKPFLSGKLF